MPSPARRLPRALMTHGSPASPNGCGAAAGSILESRRGDSAHLDPVAGRPGRAFTGTEIRATSIANGFRARRPPSRTRGREEASATSPMRSSPGADGWMFDGEDAPVRSTMSRPTSEPEAAFHRDPLFRGGV